MLDEFMQTLTPSQKRALIASLQEGLGDTPEPEPESVAVADAPEVPEQPVTQPARQTARVNDDFTVNRDPKETGNRNKVQAGKNLWTDNGVDHADVETPQVERKQKKRRPVNMVTKQCSACGREQKVNANIVYGKYHRCDSCIGAR